jgi:hypothetical protein
MGLIDFDDNEVQELVLEHRHNELIKSLNGVVSVLKEKDNSDIVLAIDSQKEKIEKLINYVKHDQERSINIDLNEDKIVSSIDLMANSVLQSLDELKKLVIKSQYKEQKLEWEFNISRNRFSDLIETVTAKQK